MINRIFAYYRSPRNQSRRLNILYEHIFGAESKSNNARSDYYKAGIEVHRQWANYLQNIDCK